MANAAGHTGAGTGNRSATTKWPRWLLVALAVTALLIAAAAVATPIVVTRWVVPTMNAELRGYALQVGSAGLRPLRAGVALHDVTIVQEATADTPADAPLAAVPRVLVGLDLRGLLTGELGLAVRADRAAMHLTAERVAAEWTDETLLFDKGWVAAFNAVSPLPINRLSAADATMTYVHGEDGEPVRITGATLEATALAADGEPGSFPSPLRLAAALPGEGRVRASGAANVTNPARPAVDTAFVMEGAALAPLQPLLRPLHVVVTAGSAAGEGRLVLTWEAQQAHLAHLRIDGLTADYIHTPARPRRDRLQAAVDIARELASRPIALHIDAMEVRGATLGFVDETEDPRYRVALTGADATLRDFATDGARRARLVASGAVMGSGNARVEAAFPARWRQPEGKLTVAMKDVEIRRLNDALRALVGLDVTRGRMSLDAALELQDGVLRGRMEPRLAGLEVHDAAQDADKNVVQQAYEAVVGAVAGTIAGDAPDESGPSAAFDVEPARVATWGEALLAVRDAWANKLRTAVRVAASDPDDQ